ncbi:RNA polymerase sigma factor [Marixanthomonas sp. SCSIO 43207]|uniref:RNA polymerase sigma factor n=1 Tax=Marixanthomonas sp. SCSIO 43207 TaxID=2779360 RepID=UPI001CA9D8D6|nr:RNA polymerase sigma factor [Marixanthomonas sp. SCSIO 43207]UAB82405.1 RNA polymerase sigma factor [Marixanthomonas sp. SCSIO 43207]
MEVIRTKDYNDNELKEADIIRRILEGEKDLYEILVRRNNQKLFRVIRSYLKDKAEVEDIMQNTYVKAFQKLYQFKMASSFSTWLIRIGINESLERLKEKGRIHHLGQQSDSLKNKTIFKISASKQLNPQEKMIQVESKQLLENAIDSLSTKYKTVYILKEVEEMSLKEVAEVLNISLANVKIRLHRSKNMLKEKLYERIDNKSVFEFGFSRCDRITKNVMKLI